MTGVGVDIVGVDRIAKARRRSAERFVARLCDSAEQAWVGDDDVRLAAAFALKEAWIKANGGRPSGFSWTACTFDLGGAVAPSWLAAAEDIVAQPVGGLAGAWMQRDGEVIAFVGDAARAEFVIVDVASADASRLSEREREYCRDQISRVAGRLAAKEAVCRLAGDTEVEVLPGGHPVDSPVPCRGESHPPVVLLGGAVADVRVSISHDHERAIAVAYY